MEQYQITKIAANIVDRWEHVNVKYENAELHCITVRKVIYNLQQLLMSNLMCVPCREAGRERDLLPPCRRT